jgi:uncharacterized membrane protein YbaN (DUF454 family)
MTRTQKLIGIAVLAALLAASFFLVEEYWVRFTAAFVVAAFARAIWVAPMR